MKRVILGYDKFRQNVHMSERIFISEIFVHPMANRAMRSFYDAAFHVEILTHLQSDRRKAS